MDQVASVYQEVHTRRDLKEPHLRLDGPLGCSLFIDASSCLSLITQALVHNDHISPMVGAAFEVGFLEIVSNAVKTFAKKGEKPLLEVENMPRIREIQWG